MSTILAVPPRKEEVRHAPLLPGVGTGHVDEAVERVLCGRFAERSFVHVHGSSALNATASFGAREAAMAKRSASVKSDSRRTSRRGYTRCIDRSEEHTSELQSLMRISYAVFCLKKKTNKHHIRHTV